MLKTLEILLFSLIAFNTLALETFRHPTCHSYIHNEDKLNKSDKKLIGILKSQLRSKGYVTQTFDKKKRLNPGDFHVTMKKTLTGKVYKECLIELKIQQAKSEYANNSDPIFFKKESNRKFPRQTFEGNERCRLALKDLFFSMNICKSR